MNGVPFGVRKPVLAKGKQKADDTWNGTGKPPHDSPKTRKPTNLAACTRSLTFGFTDLRLPTYATRLTARSEADDWVTQMLAVTNK
jgi:hypothetical protein